LRALGAGPLIEVRDLPASLQGHSFEQTPGEPETLSLRDLQRHAILRALTNTKGDVAAAARLLCIGKSTLYRRLEEVDCEEQDRPGG
jgi:sigma-54 dependent transcriptional regulator, acetoin dehydrogenase operon transcriptional activator AcoR